MEIKFAVQLLPEAFDFIESAEEKAKEKIYYNIRKAQVTNDKEVFKKLNEHIWEFRTLYNGKAYRIFAFWDKTGNQTSLVLATHGIIKKTDKTPLQEIKNAENIRKEYLKNKK